MIHQGSARGDDAERNGAVALRACLTPLGDHDGAVAALERAREERNGLLWSRIYHPPFTPLRTHPRWNALAEKLRRRAPVTIAT